MKLLKIAVVSALLSAITACTDGAEMLLTQLSFSAPLRTGSSLTARVTFKVPDVVPLNDLLLTREQIVSGEYDIYSFLCNQCTPKFGPYSVLYPATANPASSVLPQGIEITNSSTDENRLVRPIRATYNANTQTLSAIFELSIDSTVADLNGKVYLGGGFMIIPRGTDPNDWQKAKSIANSYSDAIAIVR